MGIRYEHAEFINASPSKVFGVIDDLPRTADWLPPCVSLEKIGEGPNEVGDKLRYVYKQGGRQDEMEGAIVERIHDQRLHCKYYDKMFDVSVDLSVAPKSNGCESTHIIEITPKTFMAKLMSPLIRLGLRKQTHDAARNLKLLVESI